MDETLDPFSFYGMGSGSDPFNYYSTSGYSTNFAPTTTAPSGDTMVGPDPQASYYSSDPYSPFSSSFLCPNSRVVWGKGQRSLIHTDGETMLGTNWLCTAIVALVLVLGLGFEPIDGQTSLLVGHRSGAERLWIERGQA